MKLPAMAPNNFGVGKLPPANTPRVMPFARTAGSVPANPILRSGFHPSIFNMTVAASARLAPGVLGLAVLVRQASRQFRFAVSAGSSPCAPDDDVAVALVSAIERALGHESEVAVVEEIEVFLRSGSMPITCEGITSETLLPHLRSIVGSISGRANLCAA